MKKHIPNTITLLNLFSGCLAIFFTLSEQNYQLAAYFIIFAAIFDLLDGLLARLLNVQSKIGADLDSLSDVVSFGVAPSMMLFTAIFFKLEQNSVIFSIPAFLLALFSAYRLAKFNNDTRDNSSFWGLPVPANALFWIGYVFFVNKYLPPIDTYSFLVITYILITGSCALMISDIPLISFKIHFPLKSKKEKKVLFFALSLLVLSIILTINWSWFGFSLLIIIYILASLILNLVKKKV